MALPVATLRPRPGLRLPRVLMASTAERSVAADYSWDYLERRIEAVPEDAQVRGMFLREVLRLAGPRSPLTSKRYVPFSLYPQREYMSLLLAVARSRHPHRSPADALLELGLGVYELLAKSLAGTAIFAIAGPDFRTLCELAPKAYSVTLSQAEARCVAATPDEARVELRGVWVFPEVFHVGIWLGAMDASQVSGTIEARPLTSCDVDLHLRWEPR